jgi:hypothetical protein
MFFRNVLSPLGNIYINTTPTVILQNGTDTPSIPSITVTFPGGVYTLPLGGTYRISIRVYYNYEVNPADPSATAYIHTYFWDNTNGQVVGQKFLTTMTPDTPYASVSFDQILTLAAGVGYHILAVTNITPSSPINPNPYGVLYRVLGQPVIPGSPPSPPPSTTPLMFAINRIN